MLDAIARTKPLEVDPARSQLFELFVAAEKAGMISDDSNVGVFDGFEEEGSVTDLSADSLCRLLARRWGLDMAAREAQAQQTRLPADQLERMRVLWSMMRLWMEWSYAWRRWHEFHPGSGIVILRAIMSATIGERHASACRSKNKVR